MLPHRNNHKITKYYSGYQIENEMGWACNTYGVLVGTHEGKRPLRRPNRGVEYNIKKYLHEVGLRVGGVWAGLI
jgi:hypothetical protein